MPSERAVLIARLNRDAERIAQRFQLRYRAVEAEFGPYRDRIDLGSSLLGVLPLFQAPDNVKEIGTADKPPKWQMGQAVWMRAEFERGTVHMAVRLGVEEAEDRREIMEAEEGEPVPIVSDLRFFRAATDPGPPAK